MVPDKYFAGGFLYNPDTNQVLLHLRDGKTVNNPNTWSIFGGANELEDKNIPINTFIREIREEIGIILLAENVTFLRDFFSDKFNIHRFSFYAIDRTPANKIVLSEGADFKWVNLEEALIMGIGDKTKQDLVLFKNLLSQKGESL